MTPPTLRAAPINLLNKKCTPTVASPYHGLYQHSFTVSKCCFNSRYRYARYVPGERQGSTVGTVDSSQGMRRVESVLEKNVDRAIVVPASAKHRPCFELGSERLTRHSQGTRRQLSNDPFPHSPYLLPLSRYDRVKIGPTRICREYVANHVPKAQDPSRENELLYAW